MRGRKFGRSRQGAHHSQRDVSGATCRANMALHERMPIALGCARDVTRLEELLAAEE
jgi:hypothetical protein